MKTEPKQAKHDPCADGCKRGCWHDRNLKKFPTHTPELPELLATATAYCPTHKAPRSNGVMIGGVVYECGCAMVARNEGKGG